MASTAIGLHETAAPPMPIAPQRAASGAPTSDRHLAAALRGAIARAAPDGPPLGLPLAMATSATLLWARFLKFDAADPAWPDRDRFVLSAGHGALLHYALLHLTGHDGIDDADLSRLGARNGSARLDYGTHPAIEVGTGPLGHGLCAAVGMALAERVLAARFGRSLADHRTWVVVCDGDLAEGVSHEAASLAGQLRLEKLTVLWHAADGAADAGADEHLKRFAACGWTARPVDAGDPAQVAAALSMAVRAKRPTLLACRNGAPAGFGDADDDAGGAWRRAGMRGSTARRGWLKRLAHHPMRAEFERAVAGRLAEGWQDALLRFKAECGAERAALAPLAALRTLYGALTPALPELLGGAARQETVELAAAPIAAGSFAGRHIQYGSRSHGMAGVMNGMALHGGLIPSGCMAAASADHLAAPLRLAAAMRQRVIHVLHDDGAGPRDHVASLRAMPNAHVFCPADAIEAAECMELALRRGDGPSVIAACGTDAAVLRTDTAENRCARGGYVLAEANGPRCATVIAGGPDVHAAMLARERLQADGLAVAVVSLPCWDLFAAQDESYRAHVLGTVLRVGAEPASGFGWERWLGAQGVFIALAAAETAAGAIADAIRRWVADATEQERTRAYAR